MSAEAEAASSEKSLLVSFGLGVQFKNQCDLELNKIYQKIQKPSDNHIDQIQQLRKLAVERANESDQVKVKELTKQIDGIKKGLPAFTASVTFPKGRRKAESLVKGVVECDSATERTQPLPLGEGWQENLGSDQSDLVGKQQWHSVIGWPETANSRKTL